MNGRFPGSLRKVRLPELTQWLVCGLFLMEMTVAGTAQDLHLIPFYAAMEHRGITNSAAKLHIKSEKQAS